MLKSRQGNVEKRTTKYDQVFHDRFVNMVKKNPLLVLHQAIHRVAPNIRVKTRHNKKGSMWNLVLEASQNSLGQNIAFKLSSKLVYVAKGSGGDIHKKEVTHIVAEANRALAHFC
ncbi:hypothetical protein ZWY2020_058169 [Hordeum vulgare]|nr:hypothetical protein ZWY2020_058169 [Hordeum vulgare]